MEHLTFGLIQPYDVHIIQQMVQGTELSGMSFNRHSQPIFVARAQGNIVGFTCGSKGYGDQSHVMTIAGTYLYHQYDDLPHQNELRLALVHWAEESLGVTHYKLDNFDEAKPISISHIIPPQNIEMDTSTEDSHPEIASPVFHDECVPH